MKNTNDKRRSQFPWKLVFLVFANLFIIAICNAQLSTNQLSDKDTQIFIERTDGLIKGYFDNLTTIGQLETADKDIFIGNLIQSTFENEKVRVVNDIDLTKSTPLDFDIKTYLDNISLFYSSSDVVFELKQMSLSNIFYSTGFYYIKAEVVREMTIRFQQQKKVDTTTLEIYVKVIPDKLNPRIYSIKKQL